MSQNGRLQFVLLLLRISVFVVLLVWTLDKFIDPGHAARVYAKFYLMPGLAPTAFYAIGVVQLAIIVSFLIGFQKTIMTALVLAMHAISTLSSYPQYFGVFQANTSLLFWAAWPMLAACFALFYLRGEDRLWSLNIG